MQVLELILFPQNCILCKRSYCCTFEKMARIAGNKRRHNEHILSVKYEALMEIERGFTDKDVPKNTQSMWKKNRNKIVTTFKSSGRTKRQRIKEGEYVQINLACYKWLLMQRSENIPINGTVTQGKSLDYAKQLNIRWLVACLESSRQYFVQGSIGRVKISHSRNDKCMDKSSLPTILSRYQLKDIYNADEFGLPRTSQENLAHERRVMQWW